MVAIAHGKKRGGTRGRHKKAVSRETRKWEDEFLVPERPVWMPKETYEALVRVRNAC